VRLAIHPVPREDRSPQRRAGGAKPLGLLRDAQLTPFRGVICR
jgi:hypothetical protein